MSGKVKHIKTRSCSRTKHYPTPKQDKLANGLHKAKREARISKDIYNREVKAEDKGILSKIKHLRGRKKSSVKITPAVARRVNTNRGSRQNRAK